MSKLWAGRTDGETAALADEINNSIGVDCRLQRQDIEGSMAHARMLARQGIITEAEAAQITDGLAGILGDLESGALSIDMSAEDIHTFVEQTLTARIGDAGKKLHTARSRNDQVALDLRLYLRGEIDELQALIRALLEALADAAERGMDAVMPGYTHLQRAQPILFSHQLMAYASMLMRDSDRLADCRQRVNISPIGSCALAGTTYDTDRFYEAELLGMDGPCANSIDGVSDRDFCVELASVLSIIQMHLSRMAEEMVLWSSWEFGFIRFSDDFTTGSSIMPQKKNPDMAELIRGKTGRVYGDLTTLLTMLKGLPLAYNKDMQEDKEAIFDAADTVKLCLRVAEAMISSMTVNSDRMMQAAQQGFINATDLADYLTGRGIPFRDAYRLSGQLVNKCVEQGCVLETLPLSEYRAVCPLIGEDVYDAVDLKNCVARRRSYGGTSPDSVQKQIGLVREYIG
ncbi:MAG: argininosuccinate lyase [Lachnospiraceae bacterium]|nr:argininosuccinate lyase [Lachnospiraceae bacterium]